MDAVHCPCSDGVAMMVSDGGDGLFRWSSGPDHIKPTLGPWCGERLGFLYISSRFSVLVSKRYHAYPKRIRVVSKPYLYISTLLLLIRFGGVIRDPTLDADPIQEGSHGGP